MQSVEQGRLPGVWFVALDGSWYHPLRWGTQSQNQVLRKDNKFNQNGWLRALGIDTDGKLSENLTEEAGLRPGLEFLPETKVRHSGKSMREETVLTQQAPSAKLGSWHFCPFPSQETALKFNVHTDECTIHTIGLQSVTTWIIYFLGGRVRYFFIIIIIFQFNSSPLI